MRNFINNKKIIKCHSEISIQTMYFQEILIIGSETITIKDNVVAISFRPIEIIIEAIKMRIKRIEIKEKIPFQNNMVILQK